MFNFLSARAVRILTIVLVLQAVAYYALARTEPVRIVEPLSSFPKEIADWRMLQEGVVDKEIMDVLQADDVISRWYVNPREQAGAALFIAYFTTQRTGKAPHSPKNCLPGSGWTPVVNDRMYIPVPNAQPVEVNRYIVQRGNDQSLVLYWYQNHFRTVASEYKAKVYTVLDSIRHNRSDTAVVKVTIPIRDGDQDKALEAATDFIGKFYSKLGPYFPQ